MLNKMLNEMKSIPFYQFDMFLGHNHFYTEPRSRSQSERPFASS